MATLRTPCHRVRDPPTIDRKFISSENRARGAARRVRVHAGGRKR
jgi:hypothetical protein